MTESNVEPEADGQRRKNRRIFESPPERGFVEDQPQHCRQFESFARPQNLNKFIPK